MSRILTIVGSFLIILVTAAFVGQEPIVRNNPVAIVELFTSEGCSSCPMADELLKEMTDIFQKEGKEVIGLSFHVTYWNKQGWIDPYSKEEFTERQKKYVEAMKYDQLYTPQAFINGSQQFVGSNPIAFRAGVESSLLQALPYEIQATAQVTDGKVVVVYSINKESSNAIVNIVLTERNVKHEVTRGENKNRTLKHYNVVKEFVTREVKLQDTLSMNVIENFQRDNAEVVLYVQNRKTIRVMGAAKISVN